MNLKTTLLLSFLLLAGGGFWYAVHLQQPAPRSSDTLDVLARQITPDKVNRIEVSRGDRNLVLEKSPGGEWSLPGGWPTRPHEVKELVDLVTTRLQTRFAPTPLDPDNPDLAAFGLDPAHNPLKVVVRSGEQDFRLTFGEKPGESSNRFSLPTMLRVNQNPEVVTLAPNLIALLDRPLAYYQQRRLFPAEAVREGESEDRAERLAATALQVEGDKGAYTLRKTGADWELEKPVRDRIDPDKLKGLLAAVPDIWAEDFVVKPQKDLDEYGLAKPEQTVTATRADGRAVKLLLGKESRTRTRKVMRPAPPGPPGMPRPPQEETIHEKYRYAKLRDNDQIFEIKADKLDSVFVAADTLRDPRLARFRADEARRLEFEFAGQHVVLKKDKDKWRLEQPFAGDAETTKVNDILDKLANLQAKDKTVLDQADLKAVNLSPAAGTVKVEAEETKGEGDKQTTTKKSFTFLLGKEKEEAGKAMLHVQVEGWPRVNLVEDQLTALLKRPALAYRSLRVLDFSGSELARVELERGGEKFLLRQDQGRWHLDTPVKADADASKTERLTEDLGRLDAAEYVAQAPKPEDLDNVYGLAKPTLRAALTFNDESKPAQTLLIGKQRGDKKEYFAKLASDPGVFVVRQHVRDLLDQGSLAYRKLQIWQIGVDDVAEVRRQKDDHAYRLKHEGKSWKIVEPFEAATMAKAVDPMMTEFANLLAERYEAHAATDLKPFGLDRPALKLTLSAAKPEGEKKEGFPEASRPHVLLVGKPTAEGAKSRFAKLESEPAVFVVGEKLVTDLERGALDLLDRKLLSLDPAAVAKIHSDGAGGSVSLQRDKDAWRVESAAGKFLGDPEAVQGFLDVWSNLEAASFAAYGPKADWAAFGLDKPARTVTVTLAAPAENARPAKAEEHTLALGKAVPDRPASFYARLDNGPGVLVLDPAVTAELNRDALAFADRQILKFKAADVTALERKKGAEDFQVNKREGGWRMAEPAELAADGPTLDGLVNELASLRVARVAAFGPKDLKPFGLDAPQAVVTIRLTADGQPAQRVLQVGKKAEGGDRFVRADGSQVVGVLPAALADQLLAAPLRFRDRDLAKAANVDRVAMERGPRKVVFAKEAGAWKMTSPVDVEAESADLTEFVKALGKLRADQLVADKPADLKPFGLDKPEVRWRLQSGDKDVLTLLVGAPEKAGAAGQPGHGSRRYAQLAGNDLVFLLDPKLSERALAEYRSRVVWGPTDTAQVETLRYRSARNPFALEKKDGVWQAAGKPDVKVVPETVSETLDALARLKPERYVADKDPDLKLYGLDPPELVVEFVAPTGKKALYVGRAEGGSKRYYAKAWEGNYNAVFLLGEEDAAVIVRDLTAFTKPPLKKPEPPNPRPGIPRRPPPPGGPPPN